MYNRSRPFTDIYKTPETTSILRLLRSPSESCMPWPAPKSSRIWPPFSATLARTVAAGFSLALGAGGLCRGPEVKADDEDEGFGDCGRGRLADGDACNGGGLNTLEDDDAVDEVAANRDSFDGCWPNGRF
jgi:hypothetical protein